MLWAISVLQTSGSRRAESKVRLLPFTIIYLNFAVYQGHFLPSPSILFAFNCSTFQLLFNDVHLPKYIPYPTDKINSGLQSVRNFLVQNVQEQVQREGPKHSAGHRSILLLRFLKTRGTVRVLIGGR